MEHKERDGDEKVRWECRDVTQEKHRNDEVETMRWNTKKRVEMMRRGGNDEMEHKKMGGNEE